MSAASTVQVPSSFCVPEDSVAPSGMPPMVKETTSSPASAGTALNTSPSGICWSSAKVLSPVRVMVGASASGATVTVSVCTFCVVSATPSVVAVEVEVAVTVRVMSSALSAGGVIARSAGTTPSAKVMEPFSTVNSTPPAVSTAPSGMPDRVTLRVSVPAATPAPSSALIGRATEASSVVATPSTTRSGRAASSRSATEISKSPNCNISTPVRVSVPSAAPPATDSSPVVLSRSMVNSSKSPSNTAVSTPSPPTITSSPAPPVIVSSPRPPTSVFSPSEPMITSSPAPPMTFSMLTKVSSPSAEDAVPAPRST